LNQGDEGDCESGGDAEKAWGVWECGGHGDEVVMGLMGWS